MCGLTEWLCLISLLRCWCAVADFGGGPQGTALDNKREFQDQGIICLRNLKQTMKFGGRRMLPDMNEISAILSGKYTKIQKLWVPSPAHSPRTLCRQLSTASSVQHFSVRTCPRTDLPSHSATRVAAGTSRATGPRASRSRR